MARSVKIVRVRASPIALAASLVALITVPACGKRQSASTSPSCSGTSDERSAATTADASLPSPLAVGSSGPSRTTSASGVTKYDPTPLLASLRPAERSGLADELGVHAIDELPLYDLSIQLDDALDGFALDETIDWTNTSTTPHRRSCSASTPTKPEANLWRPMRRT